MKFVFLTGGFVGFLLAAITGLCAERDAALVLRDAALGCLVGACLFRWFWSAVVKALAETVERRRHEALKSENGKLSAPPAPTPAASPMPAAVVARTR